MTPDKLNDILKDGFPTTKDENWKYTNLAVLNTKPVVFSSAKVVKFKNHQQLGVTFVPLALSSHAVSDVFEELNVFFSTENYHIKITENLSEPLEIFYQGSSEGWSQPRIKITVEKNVQATIIEIFTSEINGVMNSVLTLEVAENAKLNYYKVQSEHEKNIHIGRTHIYLDKNSHIETFTLSKGSQLARSDISVKFQGEYASCNLYGLSYSKHRQHLDHHTIIDHAVGHCTSNEFYRSVLDDKSRVVFNGRVIVRDGATQTETHQVNHNLLLSSDAEIDTKPELEIYHDDVKCTHGATIGQLDEEALFYLRSRGLSEAAARELLIQAFGDKVLQCITDEKLRERLCRY